jgi:hypothetical protein
LGTGSHKGFTRQISKEEFTAAERNFLAIRKDFSDMFPGEFLGDAQERVLVFSGLWKHLPSVAAGQQVRELDAKTFRGKFATAMGYYNAAAREYKAASEFDIGKGKFLQAAIDENLDALTDSNIMFRFKDMGGAWFADGSWWSRMLGTGLGELGESWTKSNKEIRIMPSDRWADIARPDSELNAKDLDLKRRAFKWMQENTGRAGGIELDQFERAAEYLAALSRYKIRAFQMIDDSRPSDRDIEILLGAFVSEGDSDTNAFVKLAYLQRSHVRALSRNLERGRDGKAVFSPTFLVNLDHTSRALRWGATFDIDPRAGGRGKETADLFKESASIIGSAARLVSGRILPGNRGGAISPLSKAVDEEATANLYRLVSNAAQREFPQLPEEEAVKKFVDMGFHLKDFLGVFRGPARQSTPPGVIQGGRILIPAFGAGN